MYSFSKNVKCSERDGEWRERWRERLRVEKEMERERDGSCVCVCVDLDTAEVPHSDKHIHLPQR